MTLSDTYITQDSVASCIKVETPTTMNSFPKGFRIGNVLYAGHWTPTILTQGQEFY